MNRKRKHPTQRSLTKKPRLIDEKSAANTLLTLSNVLTGAGKSEEEISVANTLSTIMDIVNKPCESNVVNNQYETQHEFDVEGQEKLEDINKEQLTTVRASQVRNLITLSHRQTFF